ncbi:MAG: hypothetical protein JG771_995 [Methermicoccus sp.]|nr:hypothetical protein [Methermicoccus sp.]
MPTWIAKNDLWAIAETGYTSKQVQTGMGEVGINTPRDRDSRFEPEFIKKRERVLADSVSDRIIGLYALGNSTRGIRGIGKVGLSGLSQHRKEMDNASLQLGGKPLNNWLLHFRTDLNFSNDVRSQYFL